jgi:hypothetical protein
MRERMRLNLDVAAVRFGFWLLGTFAALATHCRSRYLLHNLASCAAADAGDRHPKGTGAARPAVLKMVIGEGLALTGIGIAAGAAAALALTRVLEKALSASPEAIR